MPRHHTHATAARTLHRNLAQFRQALTTLYDTTTATQGSSLMPRVSQDELAHLLQRVHALRGTVTEYAAALPQRIDTHVATALQHIEQQMGSPLQRLQRYWGVASAEEVQRLTQRIAQLEQQLRARRAASPTPPPPRRRS